MKCVFSWWKQITPRCLLSMEWQKAICVSSRKYKWLFVIVLSFHRQNTNGFKLVKKAIFLRGDNDSSLVKSAHWEVVSAQVFSLHSPTHVPFQSLSLFLWLDKKYKLLFYPQLVTIPGFPCTVNSNLPIIWHRTFYLTWKTISIGISEILVTATYANCDNMSVIYVSLSFPQKYCLVPRRPCVNALNVVPILSVSPSPCSSH